LQVSQSRKKLEIAFRDNGYIIAKNSLFEEKFLALTLRNEKLERLDLDILPFEKYITEGFVMNLSSRLAKLRNLSVFNLTMSKSQVLTRKEGKLLWYGLHRANKNMKINLNLKNVQFKERPGVKEDLEINSLNALELFASKVRG